MIQKNKLILKTAQYPKEKFCALLTVLSHK